LSVIIELFTVAAYLVYCAQCGTQNREARFCSKCGAALYAKRGMKVESSRRDDSSKLIPIIVIVAAVVVISIIGFGMMGRWWPLRPVTGVITGSGNLVTLDRSFSDFTVVDVSWGFEVTITKSDTYDVSITIDDNLIDYLQVSKSGNTLHIGLKPVTYNRVTQIVNIQMPLLHELQLSSESHGFVEGFYVPPYYSSDFNLGLSGGCYAEMEGSANKIFVEALGGSLLDLTDFPVHNADVELSGGSVATINLDGRLDANLSGGSLLLYIGEPILGDIDTSGGSFIEKNSGNNIILAS